MKPSPANLAKYAEAEAKDRLKIVSKNLRKTRKHPDDAEAIHDLRVAIRRYTQCLRTFIDVFDPAAARKIRRGLRKLMDRCGNVRNLDVATEVLETAGTPPAGSLKKDLRKQRKAAERDLRSALDEWQARKTPRQWQHSLESKAKRKEAKQLSVPLKARAVMPSLAEELFLAGARAANPKANPEKIHEFRLLTKRFRYALELFRPVYEPGLEAKLEELRNLQDRLGAINDCAITVELIRETPHANGNIKEPSQALAKLMQKNREEFRTQWEEHFNAARRQEWLQWLTESAAPAVSANAAADAPSNVAAALPAARPKGKAQTSAPVNAPVNALDKKRAARKAESPRKAK
jgi:CHAD domain-containing protein